MNIVKLSDAMLKLAGQFEFYDDFHWFISPHAWTSLSADAGVTAPAIVSGGTGGRLTMASGTTDNNEVGAMGTNGVFKILVDKPIVVEARVQFAEAATSAANVFVGLSSVAAANQLKDDGAGPDAAASQTTIGIYKVDGETVWRCVSQKATTQTVTQSTTTAGGSADQTLRIECQPVDSTTAEITFYVDGAALRDSNNLVIKHVVTFASAAAMKKVIYLKGGSTTSETLVADYFAVAQLR
jgi:hypothetical protein